MICAGWLLCFEELEEFMLSKVVFLCSSRIQRGISIFDIEYAGFTSFDIKFAGFSKYDTEHANFFKTYDFGSFV